MTPTQEWKNVLLGTLFFDLVHHGIRMVMGSRMGGVSVTDIAEQMCVLLNQQIQALSDRRLDDLTEEERGNYELRRKQIAVLRTDLNDFVHPN